MAGLEERRMKKRIRKKFRKKSNMLIQELCILGRLMGNGPHFLTPTGYEIDKKAIRRYKKNQAKAYRELHLDK